MVGRNEAFQVERIKQSILISVLLTHHHGTINAYAIRIFYQAAFPTGCFSTEYAHSGSSRERRERPLLILVAEANRLTTF